MIRPSYHARRAVPVVAAVAFSVVSAALWIGASIVIGSRVGEAWAGSRRQSIGDFRNEVVV